MSKVPQQHSLLDLQPPGEGLTGFTKGFEKTTAEAILYHESTRVNFWDNVFVWKP